MRGVAAHLAPASRSTQQQSVAILGKYPACELPVAKSAGSFLNGAHELAAHAVTSERSPYIDAHFPYVIERDTRVVRPKRGPPGNPVADIGHEHRMLGVVFRAGDQEPLIVHGTWFGIECLQMVMHGFVENLADGRSVLFPCRTYLQLRSRGCGTHRP